MSLPPFKSGFISIVGNPNVGKSTLLNAVVGERLSIITPKAQTTRHRIFGIVSGQDYQYVFSDTPGILEPGYKLQENMMKFVNASLEDADLILHMVELGEKHQPSHVLDQIYRGSTPVIMLINKIDLARGSQLQDKATYWKEMLPVKEIIGVSALEKINLELVMSRIREIMPEHPAFFPEDTLTDKTERFICSEIIREKIFLNYKKEVPYSCEVGIESFVEETDIIRVRAIIFVERSTQKGIVIGNKGESLKKTATEARLDMESFFGKKVFLETYVKVEKDWRKKERSLKKFGYINI